MKKTFLLLGLGGFLILALGIFAIAEGGVNNYGPYHFREGNQDIEVTFKDIITGGGTMRVEKGGEVRTADYDGGNPKNSGVESDEVTFSDGKKYRWKDRTLQRKTSDGSWKNLNEIQRRSSNNLP